jgi:hypothetical protein
VIGDSQSNRAIIESEALLARRGHFQIAILSQKSSSKNDFRCRTGYLGSIPKTVKYEFTYIFYVQSKIFLSIKLHASTRPNIKVFIKR